VPNQLRILFRCVGPFTNALAQQLTTTTGRQHQLPTLHMQGFYGYTRRLEQVKMHGAVVFVAGGIGITPFLSLLYESAVATAPSPRKVTLHWVCRDPELIDYVQKEYLYPILNIARLRDRHVQFVIHRTDPLVTMGRSYSSFDHSAGSHVDIDSRCRCVCCCVLLVCCRTHFWSIHRCWRMGASPARM
jgi:Ferric reductase NAD binding domain